MRRLFVGLAGLVAIASGCEADTLLRLGVLKASPSVTTSTAPSPIVSIQPSPAPTVTPSASASAQASPSPSPRLSPTPTLSPSPSPTPTPSPSPSPTPIPCVGHTVGTAVDKKDYPWKDFSAWYSDGTRRVFSAYFWDKGAWRLGNDAELEISGSITLYSSTNAILDQYSFTNDDDYKFHWFPCSVIPTATLFGRVKIYRTYSWQPFDRGLLTFEKGADGKWSANYTSSSLSFDTLGGNTYPWL